MVPCAGGVADKTMSVSAVGVVSLYLRSIWTVMEVQVWTAVCVFVLVAAEALVNEDVMPMIPQVRRHGNCEVRTLLVQITAPRLSGAARDRLTQQHQCADMIQVQPVRGQTGSPGALR